MKNFTKKISSLALLAQSKILSWVFCVVFLFLSLLAICSEVPYQKFCSLASRARTEIINMASYDWRSIALILIMHVYTCMQNQNSF